jgi:L-ascorbate metabolism protein UlaG (beta-lactamase superfamily)
MKVIFVHHSCFVVEADDKVLIFDWFGGDRLKDIHFGGVLPQYAPDTPIYVFASHKHIDHFDPDILHLAEQYADIHYILAKDCKMSPNYLQRLDFSPEIQKKITYLGARESRVVDGVSVETLRSTDAGVAYYVEVNGIHVYHGGDLNDWYWEGAGDLVNGNMTRNYRREIKALAGKKVHIAFVPLDPRLEAHQTRGIDFFMETVDADYVFPMHLWHQYDAITSYKKRISNAAMAGRIVEITQENQTFDIRVDG